VYHRELSHHRHVEIADAQSKARGGHSRAKVVASSCNKALKSGFRLKERELNFFPALERSRKRSNSTPLASRPARRTNTNNSPRPTFNAAHSLPIGDS
jgi:hypothetical protein